MIDNKLISQINTALSKESKVKLAYVLESTVTGKVTSESDFDLAVETSIDIATRSIMWISCEDSGFASGSIR